MSDLVVELYDMQIGALVGDGAEFDFVVDTAAVERFGLDSVVLSLAIPLAVVPARARRGRRQNFFRELLPEGRMLTSLARAAGVTERDVIGMLRVYGRDVAGALQIWDPESPGEPRVPALELLGRDDVAALLADVASFPLANKPRGGKTSLAGVQEKIVLVRSASGWARALDGYPSTHILKPESRDYPTIIYDEEYGSRFARALGLASFSTRVEEFGDVPALVVERDDRTPFDGVTAPRRIHQEDFSQVLGARGDEKYQRYGGRVSLARIARELVVLGDGRSVEHLARMVVLSAAIGNLDMHAKNIALVHHPDGTVGLAPSYDNVPQAHLPNDGELALAVDGVYRHGALTRSGLIAEIASWGVRDPARVVGEALATVEETARSETPDDRAHPGLVDDIVRFTVNLRSGRAVGDR